MVAITYGMAGAGRAKPAQRSWLGRFYDALLIARQREADRQIAQHRHLLSAEPMTFDRVRRDDLPFAHD